MENAVSAIKVNASFPWFPFNFFLTIICHHFNAVLLWPKKWPLQLQKWCSINSSAYSFHSFLLLLASNGPFVASIICSQRWEQRFSRCEFEQLWGSASITQWSLKHGECKFARIVFGEKKNALICTDTDNVQFDCMSIIVQCVPSHRRTIANQMDFFS